VSRLHGASKTPLAVAGILAVPLFFTGLMAFALKLDKPSHQGVKLGDPTKGTIGTIYLAAFALAGAVVVIGFLAVLLRSRAAAVVPAVAGIVASLALLIPLGTWTAEHTKRYPLGVDNIPKKSPQDLYLKGEWEQNAETTARQLAYVTIGISIAAIALLGALEIRRRRGRDAIVVPPPPIELETGGAAPFTGV
jgi:hypothetical protein